jgi:hypothetical protein
MVMVMMIVLMMLMMMVMITCIVIMMVDNYVMIIKTCSLKSKCSFEPPCKSNGVHTSLSLHADWQSIHALNILYIPQK